MGQLAGNQLTRDTSDDAQSEAHSSSITTGPVPSNPPSTLADLPPEAPDLASKLFNLARSGDSPALAAYLTAGIPLNLTNHAGDTLLMLAAYHGHAEMVRMLMGRGADVNTLNGRGQSPIAGAVFKGYDEVVRVLYTEGNAKIEGEGAGQPGAVDCARMFRRQGLLELFGMARGGARQPNGSA